MLFDRVNPLHVILVSLAILGLLVFLGPKQGKCITKGPCQVCFNDKPVPVDLGKCNATSGICYSDPAIAEHNAYVDLYNCLCNKAPDMTNDIMRLQSVLGLPTDEACPEGVAPSKWKPSYFLSNSTLD